MSSAYHLQMDGQTEVPNRAFEDLLRCLVGDNIWSCDNVLCKAEFAHNQTINRSTCFSPFCIIYGLVPHSPIDLVLVPDHSRFHAHACDVIDEFRDIHQ